MSEIKSILSKARQASHQLANAATEVKNAALLQIAEDLLSSMPALLQANELDLQAAREAGKSEALIDRLALSEDRLKGMAASLREIATLPDPIGEIYDLTSRPSGIQVGRMRIPLGVIGIIFEARPNVVTDAGALCLKSGNAVILRGGSEAQHSNKALGALIENSLQKAALPPECIQVVGNPDRQLVLDLLTARGQVDLVIPRGGESLIRFVNEHATVPLVFHYKGVCHAFVDKDADLNKALPIILNAKTQRPGVCNALETLLIHQDIAADFLPEVVAALRENKVEVRGCERSQKRLPDLAGATEEDWAAEYLDLILSIRIVDDFEQAAEHIRRYGSNHTETIVTENYSTAGRFLREIQSSCVAVNASTRFNDGGELGLGAEIGISTTKMHAYGPMGLRELTASKFIVLGNGQVRK